MTEPRYVEQRQVLRSVTVTFRSPPDIGPQDDVHAYNFAEVVLENTSGRDLDVSFQFDALHQTGYSFSLGAGDTLQRFEADTDETKTYPGETRGETMQVPAGGTLRLTGRHLVSMLQAYGLVDGTPPRPTRALNRLCPSLQATIGLSAADGSSLPDGALRLDFKGKCYSIAEDRDWAKDVGRPIPEFRPAYVPIPAR